MELAGSGHDLRDELLAYCTKMEAVADTDFLWAELRRVRYVLGKKTC